MQVRQSLLGYITKISWTIVQGARRPISQEQRVSKNACIEAGTAKDHAVVGFQDKMVFLATTKVALRVCQLFLAKTEVYEQDLQ